MYGVFKLDPLEWRLLYGLHSDGDNKALPPGTGKGTLQKVISKGYVEQWTKGSGRYAAIRWRRTPGGDEAFAHDDRLGRPAPKPWGSKR